MAKLLGSVLDRISENNNEYRKDLRSLNSAIDEKTTALVGDIVTNSNYTVDFSNAMQSAKEMLVNPISRIIESYVIKDLRGVETVNEQFIDKINDKMDSASLNTKDDKEAFINNLNALLNDKYLEIVKIKRVDFLNNESKNEAIESAVQEFISYLVSTYNVNESSIVNVINSYKDEIYDMIIKTLASISKLYLDNFTNGVNESLNSLIDYSAPIVSNEIESFKPYIPEFNPVVSDEVPIISQTPEIPIIPEVPNFDATNDIKNSTDDIPFIPEVPVFEMNNDINNNIEDISSIPEVPNFNENEIVNPYQNEDTLMDIPTPTLVEVMEPKKEIKKTYDVEEILKIAKSPIVSQPIETKPANSFENVEVISNKEESIIAAEYNEREIVEEMIDRLTKRLKSIDERQSRYEEDKRKLEEDEAFVNDLIESAEAKKDELNRFEVELQEKESELIKKEAELEKKINDVLPFANAVLNSEKESNI